jgi:hypothetical protein
MSNSNRNKRQVHLVGSVPLQSPEDVFRTSSSILGDCLPRIPDGETGNRLQWIMYQYIVMSKMPEFEVVGGKVTSQQLTDEIEAFIATPEIGFDMHQRQLQIKEGVKVKDIKFPTLGYADVAKASYKKFAAMKKNQEIHESSRFQVSLPTPLAPIQTFFSPKGHGESMSIYRQYKKAMLNELSVLTDAIPVENLAIQWDVCIEIVMLENRQNDKNALSWQAAIPEELCSLAESVPEPVEVGYHLCYGDMGHKHFIEPHDTKLMTDLVNTLSRGVSRSIQWIHMPVPRDRNDKEYFQPLSDLRLKPETRLFLGLVHYTDGLEGTLERIKAATSTISDFGVATECGLGRRDPATIPELLKLHLQAANQP